MRMDATQVSLVSRITHYTLHLGGGWSQPLRDTIKLVWVQESFFDVVRWAITQHLC